jgi:4-hydroxy-3-polyprenylbenzoate decarboxylase
MTKRLIVGMTGASGAIYGQRLLQALGYCGVERHLVISKAAALTIHHELGIGAAALRSEAEFHYASGDIGAACSSGSFITEGMVIAPCSMKTLAEIANGITSSLVSRAAEVVLKERRRLVLLVRETPLTASHLRNMLAVTEMGGIIAPPLPAFYIQPRDIDDLVNHTVGRVLDLFGIDSGTLNRWAGMPKGVKVTYAGEDET